MHEVTNVLTEASKKPFSEATPILSEPMKQSEGHRVRQQVGERHKRQILQYSRRSHAYNKAMIIARNDVSSQKVAENGQLHSITDQTHPDFTRLADVKAKILCGYFLK